MPVSKEQMIQAYKNAGYRLTRQRLLIFDYLGSLNGDHPSARQVYDGLRDRSAGLSVATVYNTMGTLVRLGIMKVIEFETGDNRYDNNLEPHVNLICRKCGKIRDFDLDAEVQIQDVLKRANFRVSDCRLEYYGRCSDCAP